MLDYAALEGSYWRWLDGRLTRYWYICERVSMFNVLERSTGCTALSFSGMVLGLAEETGSFRNKSLFSAWRRLSLGVLVFDGSMYSDTWLSGCIVLEIRGHITSDPARLEKPFAKRR